MEVELLGKYAALHLFFVQKPKELNLKFVLHLFRLDCIVAAVLNLDEMLLSAKFSIWIQDVKLVLCVTLYVHDKRYRWRKTVKTIITYTIFSHRKYFSFHVASDPLIRARKRTTLCKYCSEKNVEIFANSKNVNFVCDDIPFGVC